MCHRSCLKGYKNDMCLLSLGGRANEIIIARQILIASLGGPGDLSRSGGGFDCGESSGKAITATTEKTTARMR